MAPVKALHQTLKKTDHGLKTCEYFCAVLLFFPKIFLYCSTIDYRRNGGRGDLKIYCTTIDCRPNGGRGDFKIRFYIAAQQTRPHDVCDLKIRFYIAAQ